MDRGKDRIVISSRFSLIERGLTGEDHDMKVSSGEGRVNPLLAAASELPRSLSACALDARSKTAWAALCCGVAVEGSAAGS